MNTMHKLRTPMSTEEHNASVDELERLIRIADDWLASTWAQFDLEPSFPHVLATHRRKALEACVAASSLEGGLAHFLIGTGGASMEELEALTERLEGHDLGAALKDPLGFEARRALQMRRSQVGLNADWSVETYLIHGPDPGRVGGLFILATEDFDEAGRELWAVVAREGRYRVNSHGGGVGYSLDLRVDPPVRVDGPLERAMGSQCVWARVLSVIGSTLYWTTAEAAEQWADVRGFDQGDHLDNELATGLLQDLRVWWQ